MEDITIVFIGFTNRFITRGAHLEDIITENWEVIFLNMDITNDFYLVGITYQIKMFGWEQTGDPSSQHIEILEISWNRATPESSILAWDFPWNKPSSYGGTPIATADAWSFPQASCVCASGARCRRCRAPRPKRSFCRGKIFVHWILHIVL